MGSAQGKVLLPNTGSTWLQSSMAAPAALPRPTAHHGPVRERAQAQLALSRGSCRSRGTPKATPPGACLRPRRGLLPRSPHAAVLLLRWSTSLSKLL